MKITVHQIGKRLITVYGLSKAACRTIEDYLCTKDSPPCIFLDGLGTGDRYAVMKDKIIHVLFEKERGD